MRIELELPDHESLSIAIDRAEAGSTLTQILRKEGHPLNTRCGERDLCRACAVEVWTGTDWETVPGCRLKVDHDLRVRVGRQSILAYRPQVQSGFKINVPYAHAPIFGNQGLGAAIDVGTTTVVVTMIDLATGQPVGQAVDFNRQMHLGDDVLTRINLCFSDANNVGLLQEAIVAHTLVPLIQAALTQSNRKQEELRGFVLAGNSTMLHLVLGEDPSGMANVPFEPKFLARTVRDAKSIGLWDEALPVLCLPSAAAYVGADITAGIAATGLLYQEGPSMLVDVGTNGEIALHHNGKLFGCATAAGPAFEGSGLQCGVRAGDGAIGHLQLNPSAKETVVEVIGPRHIRPVGICGSGYIDFLAEGRRSGLLNIRGRMEKNGPFAGSDAWEKDDYGWRFRIASGQGKRSICVSEADVARLLQAKAAIAAGILTLLEREGLCTSDVSRLYLAGGFGMHLGLHNAIACGLLPGFTVEQIELVGNTSLAGATLALMDGGMEADFDRAAQMDVIELNLSPNFEDTYIDQLSLP